MKSYSLVRKFSSCVGSATLTGSLFASVGTQNVAAVNNFLQSKFFSKLCNLVKDEDLKVLDVNAFWEEQEKDSKNNLEHLKNKRLLTLVKLWKLADKNTNESFQKNASRRKMALKFKNDVETVLKSDISEQIDEFFRGNQKR